MDRDFAAALVELNNDFYCKVCASFSATRQAPWPGWRRVFDMAAGEGAAGGSYRVLDLACGNMRFERFFQEAWDGRGGKTPVEFYAVDACRDLACGAGDPDLHFIEHDILASLMGGATAVPPVPGCDLGVCFGFMHHVPTRELRLAVLRELTVSVRPGGLLAVSFWTFMNSDKLAAKTAEAESRAAVAPPFDGFELGKLDPGDHLMGWQDRTDAYRYCHHFTDAEIDDLLASLGGSVQEVARFWADGRDGDLNRYVVLRRV